jgi:hypothetical protein
MSHLKKELHFDGVDYAVVPKVLMQQAIDLLRDASRRSSEVGARIVYSDHATELELALGEES